MGPFRNFFEIGNKFVKGNDLPLKLALTALLSGKHILIEDVPGKGKTILAKFVGRALDLNFGRIQFTNDLMPSDIVGFNFFNQTKSEFIFRPGPLFGEIILVDEINRASPRTQSALLQAMEEKKICIENETYPLSEHFFVMATQNPRDQVGTSPLPESQLDRFLFKFKMNDLSIEQELDLLKAGAQHEAIEQLSPIISREKLVELKKERLLVKIPNTILEWITFFLQKSRISQEVNPLGARAGIDFVEALRSWAFIDERNQVLPEDVSKIFPFVFGHRLFSGKNYSVHQEQSEAERWVNGLKT
ncbi:MAG: AAA family ATPase [Bacteriovoracaceae bacterium]|nr:AAA family ATPase [Bacteriovoracaceae bacterium]